MDPLNASLDGSGALLGLLLASWGAFCPTMGPSQAPGTPMEGRGSCFGAPDPPPRDIYMRRLENRGSIKDHERDQEDDEYHDRDQGEEYDHEREREEDDHEREQEEEDEQEEDEKDDEDDAPLPLQSVVWGCWGGGELYIYIYIYIYK